MHTGTEEVCFRGGENHQTVVDHDADVTTPEKQKKINLNVKYEHCIEEEFSVCRQPDDSL